MPLLPLSEAAWPLFCSLLPSCLTRTASLWQREPVSSPRLTALLSILQNLQTLQSYCVLFWVHFTASSIPSSSWLLQDSTATGIIKDDCCCHAHSLCRVKAVGKGKDKTQRGVYGLFSVPHICTSLGLSGLSHLWWWIVLLVMSVGPFCLMVSSWADLWYPSMSWFNWVVCSPSRMKKKNHLTFGTLQRVYERVQPLALSVGPVALWVSIT